MTNDIWSNRDKVFVQTYTIDFFLSLFFYIDDDGDSNISRDNSFAFLFFSLSLT